MKKLILSLIFSALNCVLLAQITFEKSYANTYDGSSNKEFGLVNLGNSNYKYYFIDISNSQITLYNLNHSLYKSISIPVSGGNILISYISNTLFDCDSTDIEFLVTTSYTNPAKYTRVYDENGTMLFNEIITISNACTPLCSTTVPIVSYQKEIIFNTPSGTKMILNYTNDSTKVFSLCGTLSVVSVKDIHNLNNNQVLKAYPNPSSSDTKINYSLPEGITKGEIVILNSLGKVIKKYHVDGQFSNITVPTNNLSSGIYFYRLETSSGASESKKLIVID